jgi:hypothetical protein
VEMEIVALLDLRSIAVNSEISEPLEKSLACIVSLYLLLATKVIIKSEQKSDHHHFR